MQTGFCVDKQHGFLMSMENVILTSIKLPADKQVHQIVMGSPIRPIVANLFMEEFEIKAINTATNSPKDIA